MATQSTSHEVRFGEYAVDIRTGELRRNGIVQKLQPQPAKVLAILAGRPGEIVTRQELAGRVWGSETFVDFEHGLNYAIRQIRSVLGDDPDNPHFLETIPKRGYRFIGKTIDLSNGQNVPAPDRLSSATSPDSATRKRLVYAAAATVAIAIAVVLAWAFLHVRPSSRAPIKSVAVLPLRNLSNDPEQEFFSDGMTDELITDLAKSGGLRVISHTSVEPYKNTTARLPEIAKQLGVDAIVEGTVMRSANRVRITAQLIDARSDQHLWADSYERDLRDVLSLQDDVARRIAGEIGTSLFSAQESPVRSRPLDPAAHEAYLRGNLYWNRLNCDGFNKARQYFEQAVNTDPQFARAYIGLAESYFTLADWGCSADPALVGKSKAAALKALDLDPSLGEAHAWLGKLAFFYEWDLRKAQTELTQAIDLSPNYAGGHIVYAVFLVTTGRRDLALAEMNKARDIDPISQLPNVIAIVVSYLSRDYDAAIAQGEKTIELYPESVGAYYWLGYAYERRAFYDQAIAAYLKSKALTGSSSREISAFRTAYQKAGIHGFWERELANAEKNGTPACGLASIYGHLGNRDRALEFLKQSSQQHCSGPHTTLADPIFDGFRQDPRFKDLTGQLRILP